MRTGTPKTTGIVVGEFTVSFLEPTAKLEAQVAFVDTTRGNTYGWTKERNWSAETMGKLKELRDAMETDIARNFFTEGADAPVGSARQDTASGVGPPPAEKVGGLSEWLGEPDSI